MQQTHIKKKKKKNGIKSGFMILVYLMIQQRTQKSAFLNLRLPLLFKQAGVIIFQFSNNYSYILFPKLPWPDDSEGTFRSSSQTATCPSVYHSIL